MFSRILTPAKLSGDTRCDTRRLHVYELLPPSPVALILRWQHAALYGNFKRKPRPRPRCTDCWMDRDCYHDSRATETCPSFQHLLPSQTHSCWFSLIASLAYIECLLLRIVLLISLSWWILGMLKMTIIRHWCQLTVRADMGSVWTPGCHFPINSVSYWRSKIMTKIVIVPKHVFCQSVQSVKC